MLTPFHSFVVGLGGGLVVGSSLCYLWLSRKLSPYDEATTDLPLKDNKAYERRDIEFECFPPAKDVRSCQMMGCASSDMSHPCSARSDHSGEMPFGADEFDVYRHEPPANFNFGSTDVWRKELSRVHSIVANAKETTPTLRSEIWLEMGSMPLADSASCKEPMAER